MTTLKSESDSNSLAGKVNGAPGKFDKLVRRNALRKDDDALRVLRKLAPDAAKTVEEIDALFAQALEKLERIERIYVEHQARPARLVPARDRTPIHPGSVT